jgi:hypothetical protein
METGASVPDQIKKRPGPVSLFRGKRRAPVTLTLTPAHHVKVRNNMRRLALTRADLIALLIDKYADIVSIPPKDPAYARLRDAVAALGGNLDYQPWKGPLGGKWVLELGGRSLPLESDESKRSPILDACYQSKPDLSAPASSADHPDEIDVAGLAALFDTHSRHAG